MGATITGWGKALPDHKLDNATLAARTGQSEGWIYERTGIRYRRIAGAADSTASLATSAAEEALRRAHLSAQDLDLVVVATITPDFKVPGVAPLVQDRLGAAHAGSVDVVAGCAGFLYGLANAAGLIEAGFVNRALVCGADVMSRIVDYADPKSCILFGDGAGAVVVERASAGQGSIEAFRLCSDGSSYETLFVPPDQDFLRMEGREVYRHAVETMSSAVAYVVGRSGRPFADIDLVIPHQANERITRAIGERLGLPAGRMYSNIEDIGNTSSAALPIAICDAASEGRLTPGDCVVFTAVGAGFSWGACLAEWTAP